MKTVGLALGWIARVWSLVSLGLLLLFVFNGNNGPMEMGGKEVALLLSLPLGVVIGMALGWWRELWGGIVAAVFYGLHRAWYGYFPEGSYFLIFAAPGFLFLVSGALSWTGRTGKPEPENSPA